MRRLLGRCACISASVGTWWGRSIYNRADCLLNGWQGLEPALALVSLSGKRLSPSDPDKTVARPPPIPWWDDLR